MVDKVNIKVITSNEGLIECSKIRKQVFGDEEQADKSLYIIDAVDTKSTTRNFLIFINEKAIGTTRYAKYNSSTIKLQRMAILKPFRGKGLASKLLKFVEILVKKEGYEKIIFDAASSAKDFYLKNGYVTTSDEFYENNRPHYIIEKEL
ncbi:MAG: GNAT family N-acetyltransferase [Coprobacillaceae bacterium]